MLTTVLAITVPLFYLFASCGIAHWVAISCSARTREDRILTALLIGLFWPLALPFYAALHNT